jgi:hypothetical protein
MGFDIPWISGSIFHGKGFTLPWIGVQNTTGRVFDKPWVRNSINHE